MLIRSCISVGAWLLSVWISTVPGAAAEPATGEDEFPAELVRMEPLKENPVFSGRPGAWDARIRERGWILREGDRWRLWYTGYDGTKTGLRMLGLAESVDGLVWKRVGDGPLVREDWIEDMMILKHGDTYHMVCEGAKDIAQAYESADGVRWKHVGPLDIRLKNGEPIPPGPRGTPTLWVENELWYLFYERGDKGVWLATSRDRKVWTNLQDEPVIAKGPGDYDAHAVALNQVFRVGGKYYASYHASAFPDWKEWNSCLAVSDDLIRWRKCPNNPILQDNKSSGQYVHDGTRWRLYTHQNQVQVHFPADHAPKGTFVAQFPLQAPIRGCEPQASAVRPLGPFVRPRPGRILRQRRTRGSAVPQGRGAIAIERGKNPLY